MENKKVSIDHLRYIMDKNFLMFHELDKIVDEYEFGLPECVNTSDKYMEFLCEIWNVLDFEYVISMVSETYEVKDEDPIVDKVMIDIGIHVVDMIAKHLYDLDHPGAQGFISMANLWHGGVGGSGILDGLDSDSD